MRTVRSDSGRYRDRHPIRSVHAMALCRAAAYTLTLATLAAVLPRPAFAQEGVIAGTVVTQGALRPLSGATITVTGQQTRTVTDASGHFRLTAVTGTEVTVEARMIGYRANSQSVRVGATDVRFVMSERAVELDQVVVTGTAGAQAQRAVGNSISRVDASEVTQQARVANVQDLINGRAAGVVVIPGTGMVGSGARIRIRGMSTFSLTSDPLIYVDGVRVNNETGSGIGIQAFGSGVVSRLNDFNPEEIENIEILKGPAAATLYGTEAARGVINIITKKGASSGTNYSFTVRRGQNMFWNYENRVPTNYWVNPTTNQIEGVNVAKTELERGTPIFRKGLVEEYNGNVSGGTGTLRYFVSGEKTNNEGAEPNNARRQFSTRSNLQITPNSKLDMQTSLGYIQSHTTLSCEAGCGGATWGAWYSNPANLKSACGPTDDWTCGLARGFQSSPPESDRAMQDWQDINRLTGSASLNFRPLSWMTHRLTVGTDFSQEKNEELLPYQTNDTLRFFWGTSADGWKYANRREVVLNTWDYVGSAVAQLTSKINATTSAGVQYYQRHTSALTEEGDYFPAPGLETIGAAGTKSVTSDGILDNNTLGFYGQEQFGWQDRLFATFAVRVDNNSSFGKDIKWVTYPKASLSWVLTEEPSVRQHLPGWVNTFKLRTAYGQSGQQPDIFTALRTYSPVAGTGGAGALTPGLLGNKNLGPERGVETELGFDAGFLQDRLGLDFTYYHKLTKDAILARPVAPSTGFGGANQFVNAGSILNQGLEGLLKAQIFNGQRYGWDANLNVSYNWGKVKKLYGSDTVIISGDVQQRIGYNPWSFFRERVVSAQYDPTTKRAINAMCDNGKGGSTPCFNANGAVIAPRVYLGRAIPAVEGSFGSNVRFLEHFHLNVLSDFKAGYKKVDNNLRIRCQIFLTCWERMHPEGVDPKELAGMQTNNTIRDWVLRDSKFLKLREVSVSYDAPAKYVSLTRARALSLNLAARNLRTWTPYTGLDPENYFLSGTPNFTDQAELPQLTSFVFTVHMNY